MQVDSQQLKKWIFPPVLMSFVAIGTLTSQSTIISPLATQAIAQEITLNKSRTTAAQKPGIYRSDRFSFRFSYSPKDFVIDNKLATPRNNVDVPLSAIDIWTKQHAQKIRSGAYEGGTEYPANVQVTVYSNPRKLTLQKWVQQSNQFTGSQNFKPAKIAGKTGIKFQSSGLYENENVAVIHPKDSRIIVVSLSKNGTKNDATYRRVYQQVINSLAF